MANSVLSSLPPLTQLVISLNGITGVSFCSLEYENASKEVQKALVNIGVSYDTAKQKDIEMLSKLVVGQLTDKKFHGFTLAELEEARTELLNALIKPNEARSNGQKDAYTWVNSGLKYHNETGELYIFGMKVSKTVLKEGEYKAVKSSTKTLAKNALRELMKSTQYRQYKVTMTGTAKLKGDTLDLSRE